MKRLFPSSLNGAWLAMVWLCLLATASVGQRYSVTDLGTLSGGTFSLAAGINSSGQVVGSGDVETGQQHAFLWTQTGGIQDLGTLPGGQSWATGINEFGHVTGGSFLDEASSAAFLWTPQGGMQSIVDVGEGFGGLSINDVDKVAGSSTTEPQAFTWTKSDGETNLNTILGGFGNIASGNNDHGQVVGYFAVEDGTRHAYRWSERAGVEDLGIGQAAGINFLGQVVGTNAAAHAFLWTNKKGMQDLGTLPGDDGSSAAAINSWGQVVGTSTGNSSSRAFIWTAGIGMRDLNTLIAPNSGWSLLSAAATNACGQIVGSGEINGQPHAFLLTLKRPGQVTN